jgi:HAD superfamily hydrolase (TIGR01459 family)
MAEFEPILEACERLRLKMICANPDLIVIRGGVRVLCAGALAVRYQEMGGDVRSLGKPDPAIYQPVLEQLGLPPEQVMAVGDSLRTDVAGAAGVDLAACWVLSGIHGAELSDGSGGFDLAKVESAARADGVDPAATVSHFAW